MPQAFDPKVEWVDTTGANTDAEDRMLMRYEYSLADMINKDAARQSRAYQQFLTKESGLMGAVSKYIHDPAVGQIFHDKWGKAIEDEVQKVADSYHAGRFDPSQTTKVTAMLQDQKMLGFIQKAMEREKIQADLQSKWGGFSEAYRATHNLGDVFALDGEDEYGTPKFKTKAEDLHGEFTYDDYMKIMKENNLKTDRGEVTRERAGQVWDHFFGNSISQEQQQDLINNLVYRDNPQAFLALHNIMHTDPDKLREMVKEHPELAQQYQQLKAWYGVAKTKALTQLRTHYMDLQEHHPKVTSISVSQSTSSGSGFGYDLSRKGSVAEYLATHEGQTVDAQALRELLANKNGGVKYIKGREGVYKDGFFYNISPGGNDITGRRWTGSDITGSYVSANDPAHMKISTADISQKIGTSKAAAIAEELRNLYTKGGAYYNESGVIGKGGILKTRGIIDENIVSNGIAGMYNNLAKNNALPKGVSSPKQLIEFLMNNGVLVKHLEKETKAYAGTNPTSKEANYVPSGYYSLGVGFDLAGGAGQNTLLDDINKDSSLKTKDKNAAKIKLVKKVQGRGQVPANFDNYGTNFF
jgi:hypothetical protein